MTRLLHTDAFAKAEFEVLQKEGKDPKLATTNCCECWLVVLLSTRGTGSRHY